MSRKHAGNILNFYALIAFKHYKTVGYRVESEIPVKHGKIMIKNS